MDDKSCEINQSRQVAPHQFPDPVLDLPAREGTQSAVLAGGCFWCTEAVFQEIEGVLGVTSGYAGGTPETADYQAVCSGRTGHAEAIEIHYDPSRVSYGQLLKVFFSVAHDPTQLNRQGADQGTQYRSAVFYHDDEEKRVAEAYIRQLNEARVYDKPIATTLEPLPAFYEAEAYHQDYAERNPMQPYILFTSAPKVAKLRKQYPERLKQLS
ncbi:MAG TPA: peptide-methionine (S)-S-oxide reductase MsrA [Thermoanaerobaculia bacterium]|nr:peptide-methionine (S)-S-oxide reductase MsrA [Thermoanaerobaculia bacterium]